MIRKTKERNVDRREVVPLKGGGAQYELPQKGNVYTMGWTPFLTFIGIFIFAFGGMFIIILCTEHLTELPKDHELYQSVLGKTDTAEKVESRVKRMERNILDSKSHTLEKEAVEENPNLLDMSKKPTQLYAPRQPRRRNSMFDNLWGPKKDNKKKSAEELKKEEDEHHDWMKDLFPHLYDDDKEKGKDGKKMKKDPWANLFGGKGDDDDSFGNLFGNPSKKKDKDGGKKNNDPFGNFFEKPKREVPSPNSAGMNSNQNTKVPPKNTNQQVPPRNTNQQVPPRNTNQQQQRATPPVNGRQNINQQANSGTARGNYNAPPNTYYNQNQQQQRGNINQQQQGNINQQQQGNINQQQQGNINQQRQQGNINQQRQQGNINQQKQQGNINQQRQQGNIDQQKQQQGNMNQQQQPQGNFQTNVNQQMRGNAQAPPQNAQPTYTNQQRQQQAYVPPQNQQQAYVPPQNQKYQQNQQNQQPIYNQQQQPNGYGQQQQQGM